MAAPFTPKFNPYIHIGSKTIFKAEPIIIAFKETLAAPCATARLPAVTLAVLTIVLIMNMMAYFLAISIIEGIAPINFKTSVSRNSSVMPVIAPMITLVNIATVATISASFFFSPPNNRDI